MKYNIKFIKMCLKMPMNNNFIDCFSLFTDLKINFRKKANIAKQIVTADVGGCKFIPLGDSVKIIDVPIKNNISKIKVDIFRSMGIVSEKRSGVDGSKEEWDGEDGDGEDGDGEDDKDGGGEDVDGVDGDGEDGDGEDGDSDDGCDCGGA